MRLGTGIACLGLWIYAGMAQMSVNSEYAHKAGIVALLMTFYFKWTEK